MRWTFFFSLAVLIASQAAAPGLALGQTDRGDETNTPASGVLYNGIVTPKSWPPKEPLAAEPAPPPYLTSRPEVVPIDICRQLFVDDFLIERTTLRRTFHRAEYYEHNPVLKPDQPWETKTSPNPCAMVFSDGVWYDPADKLFKLWYMGGIVAGTCYATSKDGLRWEKPRLDVVKDKDGQGTNLVQQGHRDSSTIWLDHDAKPAERFKMAYYTGNGLSLSVSPDGVHWSKPVRSGPTGDRTTFFYNPFRQRWVFGIRGDASGFGRIREYWETTDFLRGANWKAGEPALWVGADRRDPQRADLKTPPQLYNLDCVGYESLLLGLFTIWRGQPRDRAKPNEICVGFSRDGFHWDRPDRRAFIPVSEHYGDWNWGNVQSAGGCCLVMGDRLHFYVSGRAGVPGSRESGVCTTGLATLRRDGFASLDAGAEEGTLTSRPITFTGKRLFVNAAAKQGRLEAEVLDGDGRVIEPFSRANCQPFSGDATLAELRWKSAADLAEVAGKTVRVRFYLRGGELYSFWISPDESGASRGYVAAGGPGYDGPRDLAGRAASKVSRHD